MADSVPAPNQPESLVATSSSSNTNSGAAGPTDRSPNSNESQPQSSSNNVPEIEDTAGILSKANEPDKPLKPPADNDGTTKDNDLTMQTEPVQIEILNSEDTPVDGSSEGTSTDPVTEAISSDSVVVVADEPSDWSEMDQEMKRVKVCLCPWNDPSTLISTL
jgi:hypothetical protein